jgi:hypothetical protein
VSRGNGIQTRRRISSSLSSSNLQLAGERKSRSPFQDGCKWWKISTLPLYGGEKVLLSDYPFALVYPHCEEGDLFDYFFHQASDNQSEVSDIALQIGKALQVVRRLTWKEDTNAV